VTYLALNADVKAANVDPLMHFDQFGWREGRVPSFAFDAAAYFNANPDVAAAQVDPLAHFLANGAQEGRQPTELLTLATSKGFDTSTISRTIPTWRRRMSIRCSTLIPLAGRKAATRTRSSTSRAISRPTRT